MKIGVIGFGNLGKSFLSGIVNSGINQQDIGINAKSQTTIDSINKLYPYVTSYTDKKLLVETSDIVVIVVEPQNSFEVFKEIKCCDFKNKIIVSLMAGIKIDTIRKELGDDIGSCKIVRAMPNIAISMCSGIIGLSHSLENHEIRYIISLFDKLGYVVEVEECDLETITVTAASGLAFVSSLMNAYQDAVNTLIKDFDISQMVTRKVLENVLEIICEKNISFKQLVNLITTKDGATEAGLNSLDEMSIKNSLESCLKDAYNHTQHFVEE